jgi:phospholipid/cholesterol/gamma-HCH transport system substrate-binding protein
MDLHYKQEITVGALVLAGVAVFVLGSMWLSGRELSTSNRPVRVEFEDVGNLKQGSAVRVSGVQLGSVQEIEFVDVGRVLVVLSVDPRIQPRTDAVAEIASVGLVGDVQILFHPGRSAQPLAPEAVLRGTTAKGFMDLGSGLSDDVRTTLASFREVANKELAEDLHRTMVSLQRMLNQYSNTSSGPVLELTRTLESMQRLSARIDTTFQGPALDRALTNLDSVSLKVGRLTEQFAGTSARLDTLLGRVNRGEGTLGRIATDTLMYTELTSLSASLRAFVDDLRKNPGKITVQVKLF